MTTLDIELALMHHFDFRRNIMVPNITPISNLLEFETDMLLLTAAGYATGFEIKVSKSDLRADLKKRHLKSVIDGKFANGASLRHGKSPTGYYYQKFKFFYYAVPEELVEEVKSIIPKEFGIISCRKGPYRVLCRTVRKPKQLHSYQWNHAQILKVTHLGCMRLYNLKRNLSKNFDKSK